MFKSINILRQAKLRKNVCGLLSAPILTNQSSKYLQSSLKSKRFLIIDDSSETNHSSYNNSVNVSKNYNQITDQKITSF